MGDKVSVIIPIYKTEQYLNRCIESVLRQTHQNIELILVDDESPDNCPAMCDEWMKKDNRIKVIHKKNAGLGMARNSGIDAATGDYITFLDSDDYLHEKTFSTAIKTIIENETDICCYACTNVYGEKKFYANIKSFCGVYRNEQIVKPFLMEVLAPKETHQEKIGIGISACMVLYKAYLFKELGLSFLSEREYMNEDLIFRIELCKHIKSAVVIPQPFYFYCHNSGTLTTSYKPDRLEASVKMYEKVNEEIQVFNCSELDRRSERAFMINLIVCLKHEVLFAKQNGYFKALKNIKAICKNDTVQKIMHSYPINQMPKKQKFLFSAVKQKSVILIWTLCKLKEIKKQKMMK